MPAVAVAGGRMGGQRSMSLPRSSDWMRPPLRTSPQAEMREQRKAVEDRDVGAADADLRRRPDHRRVCLGDGGDARTRRQRRSQRSPSQARKTRSHRAPAAAATCHVRPGGSRRPRCRSWAARFDRFSMSEQAERHDGAPDVHAAHVRGNVGARTEPACRHAHADAVVPAPRRRQLRRPERRRIAEVRHPSDAERHGDTRPRRRRRREGFGWPRDGRRRPRPARLARISSTLSTASRVADRST